MKQSPAKQATWIQELHTLNDAYRKAVDRFIKTRDLKEMKSIAAEMRALSIETEALIKQFLTSHQ